VSIGDVAKTGEAATAVSTDPIELIIDRDFDTYTQDDQERLLTAIKHLLGMKGDIRVSKRRGSVRMKLELTPEQSERLYWAVKEGELKRFDVVDAEAIEDSLSRLLIDRRPPDLSSHKQEVADLQGRFIELVKDPTVPVDKIARLFVLHGASVAKLDAAVGVVMRNLAHDRTARDDLIAGALVEVLSNFRRTRDLGYDEKRGTFDQWLFAVWLNAVRRSWRSIAWNRDMRQLELDDPEDSSSNSDGPTDDMPDIQKVLETISALTDDRLRRVMLDWAAGLSGKESAHSLGVSLARISQLRKRGVENIRRELGISPRDRSI
jgi:RNA polymerase sigma factor (sigma-70 family)